MWLPVFIFCARVADVSLGTLRLICVTRGHRTFAVGLGFVEVTIWVCAVASVLSNLNQWVNVLAYAGGYATGLGLGMWLESKLALGVHLITLISRERAETLAVHLRRAGITVTTLLGTGRDGPANVCFTIVPRRAASAIAELARDIDPDVVVTIEDIRSISAKRPTRWPVVSTVLGAFAPREATVSRTA